MSTARHLLALLKSHVDGDDEQFLSVALQVAANEARLGHSKLATELRDLVDQARQRANLAPHRSAPVVMMQPKGELANLLSVRYPTTHLSAMVLPELIEKRLQRIILEQKQQRRLREHGLAPRRKILLLGPPGSGKTMTASALAGELGLPLFTILLEGVLTKFMGETASKLKTVFEAIANTRAVYLFDEFDAVGAKRANLNDVGEIRRVLNSFLQFLEKDDSESLIIAATNHGDLLDPALFRRFDDLIEYSLPDEPNITRIIQCRLAPFDITGLNWSRILPIALALSQADIVRASDEAAKVAVLKRTRTIDSESLVMALQERRGSHLPPPHA